MDVSWRDPEGLGRPLRGTTSGAAVCEPPGTLGLLAGEEGSGVESDGPAAWLACSRQPVGTLEPQGLRARAWVGGLVLASQGLIPLEGASWRAGQRLGLHQQPVGIRVLALVCSKVWATRLGGRSAIREVGAGFPVAFVRSHLCTCFLASTW